MTNQTNTSRKALLAVGICLFTVAACKRSSTSDSPKDTSAKGAEAQPASADVDKAMLRSFAPLPTEMASKENPTTPAKVKLGKMLYYETRLSKNHDISCNSCHLLDQYGVDNKPVSPGHRAQLGSRNSPSSYNAAGHFVQFWDGRAETVEEQAKGPVLNPVEMAMASEETVVETLNSIPGYVAAFKEAFPDETPAVTYDNMAKAIGAFERKLVTPSRWDKFLAGDETALSDDEKRGFNTFVQTGCTTCHTGAYVGGHIYQKLGLVKPWQNQKDQGRFEVTKKDGDKMMFKVPSLRNVEKTAPYFHDGSEPNLENAVRQMAEYQLGRATLSDTDVKLMVTWLKTLTGEIPTDYIAPPELPKSGPETPKPNPA